MDKLSWFAGVFEGEGSIKCMKIKSRADSYALSLVIKMTDEDIILRCLDAIGVGRVKGPYHEHAKNKPMWYWEVTSQGEIVKVLDKLYPMLGVRRKEKAREVLSYINRKAWTELPTHLREEIE